MSGTGGTITVKCPECRTEFAQPVGRLKAKDDFSCPACWLRFKPEESLNQTLSKARDMARKAFRGLGGPRKNR